MNERRDSEKPGEWLAYAQDDLKTAQFILGSLESCPFHIVTYHAQQCVEKALKGYLISRGEKHPYTHDLRLLMDLCEQAGADWVGRVRAAEQIMSFSVLERYPSTIRKVNKDDADVAVKLASDVLGVVADSIKPH